TATSSADALPGIAVPLEAARACVLAATTRPYPCSSSQTPRSSSSRFSDSSAQSAPSLCLAILTRRSSGTPLSSRSERRYENSPDEWRSSWSDSSAKRRVKTIAGSPSHHVFPTEESSQARGERGRQ